MRALLLNAIGGLCGGSQRSIRTVALAMRRAGHDVQVAAPAGDWAALIKSDGIATHPLETSRWLGGKLHQASLRNLAVLIRLCRRERIELLHTFQYGSYLLARAVADVLGAGHLHTVLGPLSPGQRFLSDDHITAHCGRMRREAMSVGASPHRVEVIPHRFDLLDVRVSPRPASPTVTLVTRLDGPLAVAAEQFVAAARLTRESATFQVVRTSAALPHLRTLDKPVL